MSHTDLNPGEIFHNSLLPAIARTTTAVPEMDLAGTVLNAWSPTSSTILYSGNHFVKGDGSIGYISVTIDTTI